MDQVRDWGSFMLWRRYEAPRNICIRMLLYIEYPPFLFKFKFLCSVKKT